MNFLESNKKTIKSHFVAKVLTGVFAGIANGLFGGGGGMIVVTMLMLILKYEGKIAHATALLIILPLTLLSGILYSSFGSFNTNFGFYVCIGVVLGGIIGSFLLKKLSSNILLYIFSGVMIFVGIKFLFFS